MKSTQGGGSLAFDFCLQVPRYRVDHQESGYFLKLNFLDLISANLTKKVPFLSQNCLGQSQTPNTGPHEKGPYKEKGIGA